MTRTDKTYNGLNGTIMLNTPSNRPGHHYHDITGLTIGSTPGAPYDYKRSLKVTVDIRIEQLPGARETTDHVSIAGPLNFAIQTNVWQPSGKDIVSGGQAHHVLDELDSYTYGEELVSFLKEAADTWHLNDMRAACVHQVVPEIPEEVSRLDHTSWLLDNTPPCPVNGYKYGSKWLIEPLTDVFVRELLTALADPIEDRRVYVHPHLPGIVGVEETVKP